MPDRLVNAGWFSDQVAQLTGGHRFLMLGGNLKRTVRPSTRPPAAGPTERPRASGSFRTGLFCRYRGMRYTVSLSHWPQLATLTTCGRPDTEPAIEDGG